MKEPEGPTRARRTVYEVTVVQPTQRSGRRRRNHNNNNRNNSAPRCDSLNTHKAVRVLSNIVERLRSMGLERHPSIIDLIIEAETVARDNTYV